MTTQNLKTGSQAMVDVWNSAEQKIIKMPCIINGIVCALDRDYRVNIILNGVEINECAPECINLS